MTIPRNSGRLAALGAALMLAGCGNSSGDGGDGSCNADGVERGCVAFLNFTASQQQVDGITVPPKTSSGGFTTPGKAAKVVSPTSVGSQHSFQAMVNGVPHNVTCTVTQNSWVSVNVDVVIQQTGDVNCGGTW